MTDTDDDLRTSKWSGRTGTVLTAIIFLLLLMDAAMKLLQLTPAVEATAQLGWPPDSVFGLGLILLLSTLLYAFPPTAVVGAILITAYLGGAVATHLRIGSPLFSHVLFGVYLGIALWGALLLRMPRLRELLLPFKKGRAEEGTA